MNNSLCEDGCPFQRQIEAVYEKVVTGNGEPPLLGRVKQLEVEMATALPILNDLKSSAERQEGRDQERLNAEVKRDKAWAKFRAAIVTIATIGTLIIGLIELDRNVTHTLVNIPKIFHYRSDTSVYTSRNVTLRQSATGHYYEGMDRK